MFEGWEDFFLMAGGAAAVLIGLIFVVIGLMGDRPRDSVLAGSWLYMGPIVLGVSFVLALSAAALTPDISRPTFAAVATLAAAWGLVRGIMSAWGIRKRTMIGNEKHQRFIFDQQNDRLRHLNCCDPSSAHSVALRVSGECTEAL